MEEELILWMKMYGRSAEEGRVYLEMHKWNIID